MYQDDNSKFEQDFVNLLQGLNPSEYCSMTERSVLITSLKQVRLAQIKPKKQFSADLSKMPELLTIEQKSSTGLINTKKYLFSPATNQLPNQSAVNMLYLFKVCKKIQIIFVLKNAQFLSADNKEVLAILKFFNEKFANSDAVKALIEQFCNCIGFAVEDAPDLKQCQKYIAHLKKIQNVDKFGKVILQKIIKNKRVILTNAKRPLNQFIVEINEKVKQFATHPQNIKIILQYLLNVNQVQWLNQKIEVNYIKKVENIMSKINDGLQEGTIFSQNNEERIEILEILKSQLIDYKTLPMKEKNQMKRADHYVVEHGYYILSQFSYIEDQFHKFLNNKNPQQNNFYDWNSESIIYRSVAGDALYHIFSEMTSFYDPTMCGVANYLHSFFKVFQFVPDNQLRSTEADSVQNLKQIIEKLIKTIHTSLDNLIEELKNLKQQWNVPSRKLLGLAYTIENLIKKFNQFVKKGREPYDHLIQQIQERKVYIYELFFFCSWNCFKRYQKFWNNEKKNKFFCDLYEIAFFCRNSKYRSMFEGSRLSQCSNIIIKMNEYFGLTYQKKKLYYFALKFFLAAKMNWKVITCCNFWLKYILDGNQIEANLKNISECLNILVGLGIIEQARKWCYQFMENIEENSQFIVLLQDFVQKQNNDRAMKEYLSLLTTDENVMIEEEIFKEVSKQLKKQQWLLQN